LNNSQIKKKLSVQKLRCRKGGKSYDKPKAASKKKKIIKIT